MYAAPSNRVGKALYGNANLNDRVKEVALLQTRDILSPRWNHFTAVIVAQAIQDIVTPSQDHDEPGGTGGYWRNDREIAGTNLNDDDGDEIGYGYFDTEETLDILKTNTLYSDYTRLPPGTG